MNCIILSSSALSFQQKIVNSRSNVLDFPVFLINIFFFYLYSQNNFMSFETAGSNQIKVQQDFQVQDEMTSLWSLFAATAVIFLIQQAFYNYVVNKKTEEKRAFLTTGISCLMWFPMVINMFLLLLNSEQFEMSVFNIIFAIALLLFSITVIIIKLYTLSSLETGGIFKFLLLIFLIVALIMITLSIFTSLFSLSMPSFLKDLLIALAVGLLLAFLALFVLGKLGQFFSSAFQLISGLFGIIGNLLAVPLRALSGLLDKIKGFNSNGASSSGTAPKGGGF